MFGWWVRYTRSSARSAEAGYGTVTVLRLWSLPPWSSWFLLQSRRPGSLKLAAGVAVVAWFWWVESAAVLDVVERWGIERLAAWWDIETGGKSDATAAPI
jgi:hypothetical protein